MLVISRKNGQKIMINDNIEITVVESKNGVCKLAIKADKDVKIYREEIYLQIKLANLVCKDTNINAVDSVSDLIKGGSALNDAMDSISAKEEELVVDEKQGKNSIRIKKNKSDDR